jgi:hypothetical protein
MMRRIGNQSGLASSTLKCSKKDAARPNQKTHQAQNNHQGTDHYRTKAGFYPEERGYSSAAPEKMLDSPAAMPK